MHHKLADAQKEVWECRDRAADFFDERGSLAGRTARSRQRPGPVEPNIVANPLSEKLQKLVATLRRHAIDIEQPEQRQDFTAAANRLESLAKGIDDWLGQQIPESVYWIDRAFSRSRPRITLPRRRSTWGRSSANICSPKCRRSS